MPRFQKCHTGSARGRQKVLRNTIYISFCFFWRMNIREKETLYLTNLGLHVKYHSLLAATVAA